MDSLLMNTFIVFVANCDQSQHPDLGKLQQILGNPEGKLTKTEAVLLNSVQNLQTIFSFYAKLLEQGVGTNGEPWRILVFLAEYVWGVFFVSKEMRVFGWLGDVQGKEDGVKEVGLFSVAGKLVVLLQKSTVVPNDRLLKIIYDRFFGYLCQLFPQNNKQSRKKSNIKKIIKGNEKNFLILFAYMPLAIQNQFISRIDSSLIESIVLQCVLSIPKNKNNDMQIIERNHFLIQMIKNKKSSILNISQWKNILSEFITLTSLKRTINWQLYFLIASQQDPQLNKIIPFPSLIQTLSLLKSEQEKSSSLPANSLWDLELVKLWHLGVLAHRQQQLQQLFTLYSFDSLISLPNIHKHIQKFPLNSHFAQILIRTLNPYQKCTLKYIKQKIQAKMLQLKENESFNLQNKQGEKILMVYSCCVGFIGYGEMWQSMLREFNLFKQKQIDIESDCQSVEPEVQPEVQPEEQRRNIKWSKSTNDQFLEVFPLFEQENQFIFIFKAIIQYLDSQTIAKMGNLLLQREISYKNYNATENRNNLSDRQKTQKQIYWLNLQESSMRNWKQGYKKKHQQFKRIYHVLISQWVQQLQQQMNKKSDAISVNFSLFVNYLYKLGIVGIDSKDMIGKVEKNIMQNVLQIISFSNDQETAHLLFKLSSFDVFTPKILKTIHRKLKQKNLIISQLICLSCLTRKQIIEQQILTDFQLEYIKAQILQQCQDNKYSELWLFIKSSFWGLSKFTQMHTQLKSIYDPLAHMVLSRKLRKIAEQSGMISNFPDLSKCSYTFQRDQIINDVFQDQKQEIEQ